MPYGVALDCESSVASASAYIDLTGTNWFINDSWKIGGVSSAGSVVFSNNNQTAIITGGGCCGWNAPIRVTSESISYIGGYYLICLKI